MSVNIEAHTNVKVDVYYVDDIITVAVNRDDNLQRIAKVPITVMHAVADSRPVPKDISYFITTTLQQILDTQ